MMMMVDHSNVGGNIKRMYLYVLCMLQWLVFFLNTKIMPLNVFLKTLE